MKIYVSNLGNGVTEQQITVLFSPFGKVGAVQIITDRATKLSKGYAFVHMPEQNDAVQAIEALDLIYFQQHFIRVSEAKQNARWMTS